MTVSLSDGELSKERLFSRYDDNSLFLRRLAVHDVHPSSNFLSGSNSSCSSRRYLWMNIMIIMPIEAEIDTKLPVISSRNDQATKPKRGAGKD